MTIWLMTYIICRPVHHYKTSAKNKNTFVFFKNKFHIRTNSIILDLITIHQLTLEILYIHICHPLKRPYQHRPEGNIENQRPAVLTHSRGSYRPPWRHGRPSRHHKPHPNAQWRRYIPGPRPSLACRRGQ